LIKLRSRAQITLPSEVRRALDVREGDYLEAEVVDRGVLLRPATPREAARSRLKETLSASRYVGPKPEPSEDEVMRLVVEEIKETRRQSREGRSR
jgi:AbrB family looped-hinge helix DNA binding protein